MPQIFWKCAPKISFYKFIKEKLSNGTQKCWKCAPKISFYEFIKENSKIPFITGVVDFMAGLIYHPNLYYISQENFSLPKTRYTRFVKGLMNIFYFIL